MLSDEEKQFFYDFGISCDISQLRTLLYDKFPTRVYDSGLIQRMQNIAYKNKFGSDRCY